MPTVTMVYWKSEQFWLGKLLQYPEVMTQGETLEELEESLWDAYRLMVLADVPDDARLKERELSQAVSALRERAGPDVTTRHGR
jgi:predicted RNase H-like HicB family nuclease